MESNHRITSPYHPQANGQIELCNREIKKILKKIVKPKGRDWPNRLDEALWAYRAAYKTPLGMSPFRLIFGKPCSRDETARLSISHGLVSKINPNLQIWGIKSELRGIMVNKGRIHKEFRYFRDIFWNLVKLDDELR